MKSLKKFFIIPLSIGALTLSVVPTTRATDGTITAEDIVADGATAVQYQISANGGTIDKSAGGRSQTSSVVPLDQSRFRAGSTTKMLTSTALLMLAEEGKISLDDPLEKYLPGKLTFGSQVTVRQLLNQTSGLQQNAYEALLPYDDETITTKDGFLAYLNTYRTPEALIGYINQAGIKTEPGAAWAYSNANFVLASEVISAATGGQRYQLYIESKIFKPLGMTKSSLPWVQTSMAFPYLRGYQPSEFYSGVKGGESVELTRQSGSLFGGAGALVTTTGDLNKFLHGLFEGKLISQASLTQMQTSGADNPVMYGLGLMQIASPCGTIRGHNGNVYGYTTAAFYLNGTSVTVAVAEGTSPYASHSAPANKLAFDALCPASSQSSNKQAAATAAPQQ